jgi:hypothetical protein
MDFVRNEMEWHDKLVGFMMRNGFDPSKPNHVSEIAEWFKNLRPAQMCSGKTFLSMIKMNSMNSTQGFKSLWIHPEEMAGAVFSRSDLSSIMNLIPEPKFLKEQYLIPLVKKKQGDMNPATFPITYDNDGKATEFQLREYHKKYISPVPRSVRNKIESARAKILGFVGEGRVRMIDQAVDEVLEHVKSTLLSPIGIAWAADERVRSDFTVFSIVGPHMGNYGGAEAILLLKPEVMFHPDFNMTMYAASSFNANKFNWYHGGFHDDRRAWMGETSQDRTESMLAFSHEKYHPSAPGWEEDAAREWICRVFYHSRWPESRFYNPSNPPMMNDVTLDMVKILFRNFTGIGSHTEIEGHVPCSLPLEYVDRVILMKRAKDVLCADSLGRTFLERMGKKEPERVCVVGDDRIDSVWNAAIMKSGTKSGTNVPSGFTFTVSEAQPRNTFVPMPLPQLCTISFGIVGGSFSMFLTNFPDEAKKKPNEDSVVRKRVYIEFDVDRGEVSTRFEQNRAGVGSSTGASTPPKIFNIRHPDAPAFEEGKPMYWGIVFNSRERVIRVRLIGTSSRYFQSEIAIRDVPREFSDLRWIGYCRRQKLYSVWDLNYTEGVDLDLFPQ